MNSLILLVFVVALMIFLPGWLWARVLVQGLGEKDFAVQLGLGLGLGLAIVPSFIFFINAAFSVPIGRWEVFYVTVFLVLIPLLAEGIKRKILRHRLLRRLHVMLRSLEG